MAQMLWVFTVVGGDSQCWEIIIAQSHLQRQACRGCVPVHNPQTAHRNRQLQGSRASRRWSICSFFVQQWLCIWRVPPPLCAVADIPGIIQGAHLNRGLGLSFLRHIERCRFLLFVLDMSCPDPWAQLQHLHYELDHYEPDLSQRPQAIIANKMDLPDTRSKLEALKNLVTRRVIPVSAVTGQNTEELLLYLRELYDDHLPGQGSREDKSTAR